MKNRTKYFVFGLMWVGLVVAAFAVGRKTATPTVRTLSDLNAVLGKRTYFINEEVKCPNGKNLGRLIVDLDLANEKIRVVRNDPGKYAKCD